jgi:hypothetical protein
MVYLKDEINEVKKDRTKKIRELHTGIKESKGT